MYFFVKLNVVSILYAFVLFVSMELLLNVYRIGRITGWGLDTVIITISAVDIIGFVLCTILFISLIKNWLEGRNAIFWTILFWFPYFVLFIYIFATLFPMTDQEELPSPISGIIMIGVIILYPVYLAIINFVGIGLSDPEKVIRNLL